MFINSNLKHVCGQKPKVYTCIACGFIPYNKFQQGKLLQTLAKS